MKEGRVWAQEYPVSTWTHLGFFNSIPDSSRTSTFSACYWVAGLWGGEDTDL